MCLWAHTKILSICDEKKLRAVSEKLQNVKIVCEDYKKSDDFIDENTFVYFDPPAHTAIQKHQISRHIPRIYLMTEKQVATCEFC